MYDFLEKNIINKLIRDLIRHIDKNKNDLFKLNKAATQDTDYWINKDYKFICSYLKNYSLSSIIKKNNGYFKPKGNIFIILSYNEPFILSIIPILNAVVSGNKITVKASRRASNFFNHVWIKSGIIKKYSLNIKIVRTKKSQDFENYIKNSVAVFFFGGHKNAEKIYNICAKYFVEFYPEIEAADFKVINKIKAKTIGEKAGLSIEEAFNHSGQICHRIQGIYIQRKLYANFYSAIKDAFNKLSNPKELEKYIKDAFCIDKEYLDYVNQNIKDSSAQRILKLPNRDFPLIVLNPKPTSNLVLSAFFLPILWIIQFDNYKELLEMINTRKYHLGMNIISDDINFVRKLIKQSCYTRYTINKKHTEIGCNEGWGGTWPSGYTGYTDWINKFTFPYTVIK